MKPVDQQILTNLYNKAKEIQDKYDFEDWSYRFVSTGDKRAHTIRYGKFYDAAIEMGFDMLSTIPDCIKPNK